MAVGAVAMVLLGACGSDPDRAVPPTAPSSPAPAAGDVTVRGPVTEVLGGHALTVGRSGQEPLVVVFRHPPAVPVGAVVEVTGRVRTLRVVELEGELGIDLEPEVERFEGASCLVVTVAPAA